MGNKKTHGDKPPSVSKSPLEKVTEHIEARQLEEQTSGVVHLLDDSPERPEDDPLHVWKKRKPGEPIDLAVLHSGLIAVAQIAEAAIENGIRIGSDLNKALPTIQLISTQVLAIAAKTEAATALAGNVDDDLVKTNTTLAGIRKDLQFVKDDLRDAKKMVQMIPAIKELLGEILTRLPESPKPV